MRVGSFLKARLGKSVSMSSFLLAMLLWVVVNPGLTSAQSLGGGDGLRVMTYNVDQGTGFEAVSAATTTTQFLVAVGQTITEVRATNPPDRMKALAKQILEANATLVSLQELDQWSTGPFDLATQTCGTLTIEFDLLQELLQALRAQGGHYEIAVQQQEFAIPATPGLILPGTFFCASVTSHVAILARTDLPRELFHWNDAQAGVFTNTTSLATPAGPFPVLRGWVSVDARFGAGAFRFGGTHLEPSDANIRALQAKELRTRIGNTSRPVILAMDANAQAAPLPQDQTYLDFLAAGYTDVWSELLPNVPGFTATQPPPLTNPVSQLTQRIDLILTLGQINEEAIALFGNRPKDRTPGGQWPSDHAGVAARLWVRPNLLDLNLDN